MDELLFLESEVTRVFPQVMDTEYKELWAYQNSDYIPALPNLMIGEEFIEIWRRDRDGIAKRYNGVATDIPNVSVSLTRDRYTTGHWIIGAEWPKSLIQRYQAANRNGLIQRRDPVTERLEACREGAAEAINHALIWGDVNFNGFLNHESVPVENLAVDIYAQTDITFYNTFRSIIREFKRRSRLLSSQITILVSPDLWAKLGDMLSIDNEATFFEMLTSSQKGESVAVIQELEELASAELEANGIQPPGTNRDRFIIYQNSTQTLWREFYPPDVSQPMMLPTGRDFMSTHLEGSTEVMIKNAMRVRYYTHPVITP